MELRNFIRVLRRGWLIIFVLVVLGGGAGVALTLLSTKTYQSTAKIFVASNAAATDTGGALQGGNNFTQDRTGAYVIFAKSPLVTSSVVYYLQNVQTGLPRTQFAGLDSSAVAQRTTASVDDTKVVIDIVVTDGNPQRAAAIANALSVAFRFAVQDNEQVLNPTATDPPTIPYVANTDNQYYDLTAAPDFDNSVVKLQTIYPARVAGGPISPKPVLNIGLGVLVGLLLGLGIVVLRDVLDNTLKGPSDFEKVGVPVLGTVPFDKRAARSPIAFRSDPHSARSEAYRALRTNMQFVDVDNPPHVIVVTSAMPGEGKTTTSINLASALAEAGYRVCLVDADLRRPSVAKTLGLVGDVGFTSVLISKDTEVEDVLQNAGRNLAVLTSGPVPPNPSELLISEHARSVLADIAAKVDYCVIDTPPLLPVTDAAELSTIADATVVVARAGKTTVDQSKRSLEALAKVGEKPVGVILNMISASGGNDYSYGYYYAPYRPDRESRAKISDVTAEDAVVVEEGTAPDDPAEVVGDRPAGAHERDEPADDTTDDTTDDTAAVPARSSSLS